MKWRAMTREERQAAYGAQIERLKEWHPKFALFPVPIGYDSDCYYLEEHATTRPTGEWVWLQWVERRFLCFGGECNEWRHFEYRLPK